MPESVYALKADDIDVLVEALRALDDASVVVVAPNWNKQG